MYTKDEDYFNIIKTNEQAYWLGLLYADGNVSKSQNLVRLFLHKNDIDLLKLFNNSINSNRPISYNKQMAIVSVNSLKMKEDLILLGCIPNKTYDLKEIDLPSFILKDQNLFLSFLLGWFDGDGSISVSICSDGYTRANFRITGRREIMMALGTYLKKYIEDLNILYPTTHRCSNDFADLRINSKKSIIKIYDALYRLNTPFLLRKKEKFEMLL